MGVGKSRPGSKEAQASIKAAAAERITSAAAAERITSAAAADATSTAIILRPPITDEAALVAKAGLQRKGDKLVKKDMVAIIILINALEGNAHVFGPETIDNFSSMTCSALVDMIRTRIYASDAALMAMGVLYGAPVPPPPTAPLPSNPFGGATGACGNRDSKSFRVEEVD